MSDVLLEVKQLAVSIPASTGLAWPVQGVSFNLQRGRTLGIVGESGSGKTMLSRALLRLLPGRARTEGILRLGGQDLLSATERQLQRIRGRDMAVVLQDPMTSLNPVLTIGTQVAEALQAQGAVPVRVVQERAVALLASVGITEPALRLSQYPHQMSGGMRQRVAIAIALACEPKLLIADEPTTALDVTIQAQILQLLTREQRRRDMAMLLITHDLGLVATSTDEVLVMYGGCVMEHGPTAELFRSPGHPYTRALLDAIPRPDGAVGRRLVSIEGLPPPATQPSLGCAFSARCSRATARCHAERPPLSPTAGSQGHRVACWLPLAATAPASQASPLSHVD